MRILSTLLVVLALALAVWTFGSAIAAAQDNSDDPRVALLDQCDPSSFTAMGITCASGPHAGDVTFAEFGMLLFSPLIKTVVGHPAWRFEPSYLDVKAGHTVRLNNNGGEEHTFTEVTAFGGGFVPPLNGVGGPSTVVPLIPAAACLPPSGIIEPGKTFQLKGLARGVHTFQCCIHPWMRAVIVVE
jgi:plastocyanin